METAIQQSNISWIKVISEEQLSICVDTAIYPPGALFRTCHVFTDRCYLFLSADSSDAVITVSFARKTPACDLTVVAGEFANELINQKLRMDIAAETRTIRELIIAQAFAEMDALDKGPVEASYLDDPKGIVR